MYAFAFDGSIDGDVPRIILEFALGAIAKVSPAALPIVVSRDCNRQSCCAGCR